MGWRWRWRWRWRWSGGAGWHGGADCWRGAGAAGARLGWDHRLTDHAIITSCIHEGACRRHTMWGTTNACSSVRVNCVCDTTCSGPRVVNMLSGHSGRNVSGGGAASPAAITAFRYDGVRTRVTRNACCDGQSAVLNTIITLAAAATTTTTVIVIVTASNTELTCRPAVAAAARKTNATPSTRGWGGQHLCYYSRRPVMIMRFTLQAKCKTVKP